MMELPNIISLVLTILINADLTNSDCVVTSPTPETCQEAPAETEKTETKDYSADEAR